MATQTLIPPQQKQERISPRDMIGGFFGEIMEDVTGIPPSFEAREPITTPVPEYVRKAFSKGGITGFQTPQINIEARKKQITQELAEAQKQTEVKPIREETIVEINELNDLQLLYQGSVDQEGKATAYHEANATRRRRERLDLQLQQERAQKLAEAKKAPTTAPKGVISGGEVDLNRRFENRKGDSPG